MLESLDPSFLLAAALVTISLIAGLAFTWWIKRSDGDHANRHQLESSVAPATKQDVQAAAVRIVSELKDRLRAQTFVFVAVGVSLLTIAAIGALAG